MFKQQSKDEGACSDLAFAALTPEKRLLFRAHDMAASLAFSMPFVPLWLFVMQ